MSLAGLFQKVFGEKTEDNKGKFNRILEFANLVVETAEDSERYRKLSFESHPLNDVIRLVGRKLQTDYLVDLLFCKDESALPNLEQSELLFDRRIPLSKDGKTISDFKKKVNIQKTIFLKKDLILPWPWKRSRLINCMANIGQGRIQGAWKQDINNHFVELWLPMGVAWVHGGNHSIATGIIQGVGELQPESVYDVSDIYEYVYTDGINYIKKEDKQTIAPVKNVEFAAIFEIGRLMKQKGISM